MERTAAETVCINADSLCLLRRPRKAWPKWHRAIQVVNEVASRAMGWNGPPPQSAYLHRTDRHRKADEGDAVECSVRDNGEGIPADRCRTVFDKHETDPEKQGGMGLGLASYDEWKNLAQLGNAGFFTCRPAEVLKTVRNA